MVYCGRPSGGCYACRERKSRCDKLPEGCTQCKKAKRECPGYRQLGDVIFHNESEKVVRKAKAKEAKNKAKRDAPKAIPTPAIVPQVEADATSFPYPEEEDVVDQSLEVIRHYQTSPSAFVLLPPIEDIATGFFVSYFVLRETNEHIGPNRFDYLGDIYRDHSVDEGLISSMRAVGFASYAHSSQSTVLLQKARHQYTQAIQHTNKSLRCSEAVKKDTTLLSILVLGIFETITGCQERSLKDWSQHIKGAAAVIALRGSDQINTVAGRRMLFQVTSNLLIICLARGQALPEAVSKLTEQAVDLIEDPDPALVVQRAMMKITQLRADVLAGIMTDPQKIMEEAIKLDCVLLALSEDPPPGWAYETVYTDFKSSYVYNGRYHIYADCWIAQLWNALRTVRVILNEMIRDVLLKGFASKPPIFPFAIHTAQFQLSTDTLYELQTDILSSVPQHLFTLPKPVTTVHKSTDPQSSPRKHKEQINNLSKPATDTIIDQHIALQLRISNVRSPAKSPSSSSNSSSKYPEEDLTAKIDSHMSTQIHYMLALPSSPPIEPSRPVPNSSSNPFAEGTAFSRTYGGNFLLWPLWFAGIMDVATDEVRAFVVRNLRDIGDGLGIKQGLVLAEMLESGRMRENGPGFAL